MNGWPEGTRPITAQEAIQHLDRTEDDPDFADGMVANLEQGFMIAGMDDSGGLHFKITPDGQEQARQLIERLGSEGEDDDG